MTRDAYSQLKAYRHPDIIAAVQKEAPVRPAHVQVIVSDLCNQSCDFCAYRNPKYTSSQRFFEVDAKNLKKGLRRDEAHPERNYNPNRMIPFLKVQEILDDCKAMGVSGIQFTGGGEPTVHPEFKQILQHTKNLGMPYSLVTNGALIRKKELGPLVGQASWLRVSLDAGTKEDYAKIRHVNTREFDEVMENISRIRAHRDELNPSGILGVGFVVTPDNWEGVYEGVKNAALSGADNIRISAMFSEGEDKVFEPFYAECSALCRQAVEDFDNEKFRVYNRFTGKLDDLKAHRPDYEKCAYQHFTTYIGADLTVYRCCVIAYNDQGDLGSIEDRSFKDFWMSEKTQSRLHDFKPSSCERCQFNVINRELQYATAKEPPLHWEFV